MLIKYKILFFIISSVLFFVFIFRGLSYLDPDFGWHIRLGNITTQQGVSFIDPFSYTMSSFPFIDHEWLTNIWMSSVFELLGKLTLSILFATFAFLSILIALNSTLIAKKLTEVGILLKLLLFVVSVGAILPFFGVRPQVESWLLFAIFLKIVLTDKVWEKFKFTVPLLVGCWVNLHGSFAISIVTLFIVVMLKSLRLKKVWIDGCAILSVSIILSFVNPYGPRIWHEVWQQISDTSVRWTIQEWLPAFLSFNIFYLFLVILSVMAIGKYRRLFSMEMLGVNIFFFAQSFMSVRHVPLWVIANLPMLYLAMEEFYQDLKKFFQGRQRYVKIIKITIAVALGIFLATSYLYIYPKSGGLSEKDFYPKKAVDFLKNDLPDGQIFSEYGWGGYLVWKLPEKKVFIDGRMATWRWNAKLSNESDYVMGDYKNILLGKTGYHEQFKKYDVDTVLWQKSRNPGVFSDLENRILSFVKGGGYTNSKFSLISTLEKDGWNKVYEDEVAVIYRK